MLGLDTVLHVAEYLNESYGERFYVHKGMQKLVADGKLGVKSGGDGFYQDGEPQISGDVEPNAEELADLLMLKSFVEACKVLEEGICTVREIDLGMMAGAGLDPRRGLFPPFWKADLEGLDTILEKLEQYEESHGERFAPPRTLKRLVAQGRLGLKSGHGFYAYPQTDAEGTVKLEKRGEVAIAWLNNPPMNAISPAVIQDLGKVWDQVKGDEEVKAMVVYSSLPVVFSAGADIKAFTSMDEAAGADLINAGHSLLRELGQNRKSTVAAVNAIAFGGGCELAMACDFRVAARSAVFGQPEINLGIIPGFGGTQRLPRLVGPSKALEMNLTGDAVLGPEARFHGLVDDLVPDEQLFETAVAWARKLGGQAPVAVEQIKKVSDNGDLDEGIEAEKQGFATAFLSEDAKEGISAFLGKRSAKWQGK
jgi:enoyl-CoA hydratase / 3-hydroxyacyl-CoA dehydrogenase